jgi:hypothetical protein
MKDNVNRQDIADASVISGKRWIKDKAEALACYDKKIFGLMEDYTELELKKGFVEAAMNQPGFLDLDFGKQFSTLLAAFYHSFNAVFIELFDRGVLDRHLAVREVTDEAEEQVGRMREEVAAYEANRRALLQQAEAIAVQPELAIVDPVDQCVQDFHQMGSPAFKAKYLNNQHGREHYNAAISAGRI